MKSDIGKRFYVALSIYLKEQELLKLGIAYDCDADLAKYLNIPLNDLLFSRVAIGLLQQLTDLELKNIC